MTRRVKRLKDHYPHLTAKVPMNLEEIDPVKMKQQTDIVFLAVPTGVASKLAPELFERGMYSLDLSGDFRLKTPMNMKLVSKTGCS